MDSLSPLPWAPPIEGQNFTRERLFQVVSQGHVQQLNGLLQFLQGHNKLLSGPDFTDEATGKTVLLKALLNPRDATSDIIGVLLDVAERTGDKDSLLNAAYRDPHYKGQTALHVAIERRKLRFVRLLVETGADVQAKANGTFFQQGTNQGFYFGELPLSLAACTNQHEVVSYLLENPFRRADAADRDSEGNTVLHTLVVIADDEAENTEMVSKMYDKILVQHHKVNKDVQLEALENNEGLTPLKLAAKLGKIGLLSHMLSREFVDEETRPLSRKFTRWAYGPVRSSLYDIGSIDTDEDNSVLEIIIFGRDKLNRPQMLQMEPLQSIILNKWKKFASKLFLLNFLLYMLYLAIFTSVALFRRDGRPPFPINNQGDVLRSLGEIYIILVAVRFLYKSVTSLRRTPLKLSTLFNDRCNDLLFVLQGVLLLLCAVMYLCGRPEYVGLLVLALALAWLSLLYYTRGSRQLGIYSIMMHKMILGDLLHFLCIYSLMLFGFASALVALMHDPSAIKKTNETLVLDDGVKVAPPECNKQGYEDMRYAMMELFKFTIGMGDLEFSDHVQYKAVFYILLICYIVLTYILMLNMLIALMGNTVGRISEQSETVWNLQRAFAILDMERTLPRWLRTRLLSRGSETICLNVQDKRLRFIRVTERNWTKWRADLCMKLEEDPDNKATQELMDLMNPKSPHLAPIMEDRSLA